jgi:pimeloyl-ACP methyl ester carboxylesterase
VTAAADAGSRAPVPDGALVGRLRSDDGLALRWLEWGRADAPVLVLLHGLRSYAATFEPLARHLADRWRCVAPDARGRGGSDWDPRRDYHTDRYARDLDALADHLGLDRFALLGHSMGGATAMVWAAAHPARVDALVVEDMLPGSSRSGAGADRIRREVAATPRDFDDLDAAAAYWRGLRPGASAAAIASRVANTVRRDADGRARWIADMAGIAEARLDPSRPPVDLWPTIGALPERTLVVCGADSDFTSAETLAEVRRANPRIGAVSIAGAGHHVHDDRPDEFAERVRSFLNGGDR